MPLARPVVAGMLVLLASSSATGQELGADRFFADTPEDKEDRQSTTYDGSLTSTTFYYRENGGAAPAITGQAGPFSASPVDRIFTDLRAQLDARHISGSKVDLRADVRGRFNTTTYSTLSGTEDDEKTDVPYQSGTEYGNEIDLRELYVRRAGSTFDLGIGRQYSLELAATNFDGIKVEGKGEHWKLIIFGGLYPSRVSRDIRDDYPQADSDPAMPGYQAGGTPILPITGGLGTAYRYKSAYGGLGVVGILPLADDARTGTAEKTRVFATASGYWRPSGRVDVYHYLVVDAAGADGAGVTNLTLGVNLQPAAHLRAYANISRIDTDTLNVIAQTKLQDPDNAAQGTTLQNNIDVQRIAQDSARVGLSANFDNRFEVSTSGGLRQRGELRIEPINGNPDDAGDDITFRAAQAADITIGLVDRKSLGDMRLGLSGTSSFGVGNANLYRNRAYIARIDSTKSLADDRAELETSVTYINSSDDNRGVACAMPDPTTCYGASEVQSVTAGLLLFYRFSSPWFVIANANVGAQMSKSAGVDGAPVDQPTILTTGLLLRLAYRF